MFHKMEHPKPSSNPQSKHCFPISFVVWPCVGANTFWIKGRSHLVYVRNHLQDLSHICVCYQTKGHNFSIFVITGKDTFWFRGSFVDGCIIFYTDKCPVYSNYLCAYQLQLSFVPLTIRNAALVEDRVFCIIVQVSNWLSRRRIRRNKFRKGWKLFVSTLGQVSLQLVFI